MEEENDLNFPNGSDHSFSSMTKMMMMTSTTTTTKDDIAANEIIQERNEAIMNILPNSTPTSENFENIIQNNENRKIVSSTTDDVEDFINHLQHLPDVVVNDLDFDLALNDFENASSSSSEASTAIQTTTQTKMFNNYNIMPTNNNNNNNIDVDHHDHSQDEQILNDLLNLTNVDNNISIDNDQFLTNNATEIDNYNLNLNNNVFDQEQQHCNHQQQIHSEFDDSNYIITSSTNPMFNQSDYVYPTQLQMIKQDLNNNNNNKTINKNPSTIENGIVYVDYCFDENDDGKRNSNIILPKITIKNLTNSKSHQNHVDYDSNLKHHQIFAPLPKIESLMQGQQQQQQQPLPLQWSPVTNYSELIEVPSIIQNESVGIPIESNAGETQMNVNEQQIVCESINQQQQQQQQELTSVINSQNMYMIFSSLDSPSEPGQFIETNGGGGGGGGIEEEKKIYVSAPKQIKNRNVYGSKEKLLTSASSSASTSNSPSILPLITVSPPSSTVVSSSTTVPTAASTAATVQTTNETTLPKSPNCDGDKKTEQNKEPNPIDLNNTESDGLKINVLTKTSTPNNNNSKLTIPTIKITNVRRRKQNLNIINSDINITFSSSQSSPSTSSSSSLPLFVNDDDNRPSNMSSSKNTSLKHLNINLTYTDDGEDDIVEEKHFRKVNNKRKFQNDNHNNDNVDDDEIDEGMYSFSTTTTITSDDDDSDEYSFNGFNNSHSNLVTRPTRSLKCKNCNKLFKTPRSLKIHEKHLYCLKKKSGVKPTKTVSAAAAASSKSTLSISKTSLFAGSDNESSFTLPSSSRTKSPNSKTLNNIIKIWECYICKKSFKQLTFLTRHQHQFHSFASLNAVNSQNNTNFDNSNSNNNSNNDNNNFKCIYCDKSFVKHKYLLTHLKLNCEKIPFYRRKKLQSPRRSPITNNTTENSASALAAFYSNHQLNCYKSNNNKKISRLCNENDHQSSSSSITPKIKQQKQHLTLESKTLSNNRLNIGVKFSNKKPECGVCKLKFPTITDYIQHLQLDNCNLNMNPKQNKMKCNDGGGGGGVIGRKLFHDDDDDADDNEDDKADSNVAKNTVPNQKDQNQKRNFNNKRMKTINENEIASSEASKIDSKRNNTNELVTEEMVCNERRMSLRNINRKKKYSF